MENLSSIEWFYLACAVFGGVIFLARLTLFFLGGGLEGDFDGDVHGDFGDFGDSADVSDFSDMDHAGGVADSDLSFRFISLQGISSFFMMFGLVGLTLVKAGLHFVWTMLGGIAAGAFTVLVISQIFRAAGKLQSEGNLELKNAIGKQGTVYLTIPKGGTGKVNVVVQGALKEFEAVSEDNKKIETGTSIVVVKIINESVLVVKESN